MKSDRKRRMMVIIRKAFDDHEQNFPHTVQSYSFCCQTMENTYKIGGIYYAGSKKELIWDANYDNRSSRGVMNFEGVPIRYCPWCQAELVIIDQPNVIVVQTPVPNGHKPRIKGGIGPNLFKLAEDGSLADDPINGPQFFKATGEVRGIKKGEWFISGSIPEAYMAVADDSMGKYHIAIPTAAPPKTITVGGLTYQLVLRHE